MLRKRFLIFLLLALGTVVVIFINAKSIQEFDVLLIKSKDNLSKGDYMSALRYLNELSKEEIIEADDTTKAYFYYIYGGALVIKGNYFNSIPYLTEAIDLFENNKFKGIDYLDLMLFQALAYDFLDDKEDAIKWYRKILLKANSISHDSSFDNCCYLNLGNIYNEMGQYELAKGYYEKINKIDTIPFVEVRGDYYIKQSQKYLEYSKAQNWDKAKAVNDSLFIYTLIKDGNSHPNHITRAECMGTIHYCLNEYEEAEKSYRYIIDVCKANSIINEEVGYAYESLITTLCYQNKIEEAIKIYEEAKEILIQTESDRVNVFSPIFYIADVLFRANDYENAITAYDIFLKNYPEYMKWAIPYAVNNITWSYLVLGNNDNVIDILENLFADESKIKDKFQPVIAYLHKTLGLAYYLNGSEKEAVRHILKAVELNPQLNDDDTKMILK